MLNVITSRVLVMFIEMLSEQVYTEQLQTTELKIYANMMLDTNGRILLWLVSVILHALIRATKKNISFTKAKKKKLSIIIVGS